jgi:hypothetical protein
MHIFRERTYRCNLSYAPILSIAITSHTAIRNDTIYIRNIGLTDQHE